MSLTAGENYKIRIEYYQSGGASLIDFYWTKAGAPDHLQASLNAADVVIACFGHTANSEAEGSDRTFKLPAKQAETIEKVMSKTYIQYFRQLDQLFEKHRFDSHLWLFQRDVPCTD